MMLNFDNTGIGPGLQKRVINYWPNPDERERVLYDNPYALLEVEGIGFLLADRCAIKWGVLDLSKRAAAAVFHILDRAHHSEGHTYLPTTQIPLRVAKLGIQIGNDALIVLLNEGVEAGKWAIQDDRIALPQFVRYEDEICADLIRRIQQAPTVKVEPLTEGLMEDQIAAIRAAVASNLFILYGSPGTGKSHTIRRLVDSFEVKGLIVRLGAPTGKAAKRMEELSGRGAQTMHRMLAPKPMFENGKRTWNFAFGIGNPIAADVIIVDEFSMTDAWLFWRFLQAVKPSTRLILVGDPYQLPSVGPGNLLGDLIKSQRVPMAELTILKRQDPTRMIAANCSAIKLGEMVKIDNDQFIDFFFIPVESEVQAANQVIDLVNRVIPEKYNCDSAAIQVITALRERGALSVKELNPPLRQKLNPFAGNTRFAPGDRVIQTRNNYQLNVMNGDIGQVLAVKEGRYGPMEVTVKFETPQRTVRIPSGSFHDLEFAWAQTVHKMQGSEARFVVIPIHGSMGTFIVNRSWIYTGISRAKEAVYLVGDHASLWGAIQRQSAQKRWTRLEGLMRVTTAEDVRNPFEPAAAETSVGGESVF